MSDRRTVPGDHLREYGPDPERGVEVEQKSPGELDPGLEPRPNRVRWIGLAAGLLGARLAGGRTALVAYGSAVAVAGVLSLLLLRAVGWNAGLDVVPVWADAMVRGALGLAGYMWVVRARPGSQPA